ncbi:S-adenosyl-L-methionine-dependent methyltransferase [Tothia fuscella]|uniref:S-adenosyl-L-methionine-dependent methyltransferase n=1 Tax=Tothia fuscella TaxID=1048955 RepID=A0A9P4NL35_9PEZI|nr:S-adenosyl-L-methionine-dependent methyltransferase [Tothia fuscella]
MDIAEKSTEQEELGASGIDDVQIEAEERRDDDVDLAFGDDSASYTTSLKSSITNYIQENGRRYHAFKDGAYFLPNDEAEQDRLDLFHHIMTLRCDDKLHLAPIAPDTQRVLDLGTGTGIWAIMMGEEYPSAEVVGNDLSPVQPGLVPPNVRFEVDDMEEEWVYSSPFDYIHGRYPAGAIREWPALMRQAYRFTKPGGWVEFQDFTMKFYTTNGEYRDGCSADKWTDEIIAGMKTIGREPEPGPKLEAWIKDAGFFNVVHKVFPVPVGTWPNNRKLKQIGAFDLVQFLDGLESISLRIFTGVRGWRKEEVQVYLSQVRKDLMNPRMQMQHNFHVAYSQKPAY